MVNLLTLYICCAGVVYASTTRRPTKGMALWAFLTGWFRAPIDAVRFIWNGDRDKEPTVRHISINRDFKK